MYSVCCLHWNECIKCNRLLNKKNKKRLLWNLWRNSSTSRSEVVKKLTRPSQTLVQQPFFVTFIAYIIICMLPSICANGTMPPRNLLKSNSHMLYYNLLRIKIYIRYSLWSIIIHVIQIIYTTDSINICIHHDIKNCFGKLGCTVCLSLFLFSIMALTTSGIQ